MFAAYWEFYKWDLCLYCIIMYNNGLSGNFFEMPYSKHVQGILAIPVTLHGLMDESTSCCIRKGNYYC